MTTLTQLVAARRQPLVVRWELVADAHGRTRPQMRWEPSTKTPRSHEDGQITLAA